MNMDRRVLLISLPLDSQWEFLTSKLDPCDHFRIMNLKNRKRIPNWHWKTDSTKL